MKNKLSFNPILIGFIIIVALAGGYLYFTSTNIHLSTITATVSTDLFSNIGSIQLDTSVLSDPRFNALTNIAIPVGHESMGRTDPFALFR